MFVNSHVIYDIFLIRGLKNNEISPNKDTPNYEYTTNSAYQYESFRIYNNYIFYNFTTSNASFDSLIILSQVNEKPLELQSTFRNWIISFRNKYRKLIQSL